MSGTHRRSLSPLLLAPLLAVTGGCDPAGPDPSPTANVEVFAGADVTMGDSAVLVGGVPRIQLGTNPSGTFVQHSTRYSHGGPYERVNDELVGESWYMDVRHAYVSDERADTLFVRYLDFGDVTLEGTAAGQIRVDEPEVVELPDHVRVYENYILNRISIYGHRLNLDGSTVTFTHEPFYEDMVAGQPLTLTASGSHEIEPLTTSVALTPGARVTAFDNGGELAFDRERPVLRPDEPLVVALSRAVDPDRTILYIRYVAPSGTDVDPAVVQQARAAFGLTARTDQVVIPASALTELANRLPPGGGALIFTISEYLVDDEALEVIRVEDGAAETLSGLQVNHFHIYVDMET